MVTGWWGVAVAAAGQFLLFALIGLKRWRNLNAAPALVLGAVGRRALGNRRRTGATRCWPCSAFALLLVYVFWYSRNGRTPSAALTVGSPLPELAVHRSRRRHRATRVIVARHRPSILLFYRGTWCPLCNVQVKELAEGYRDIEALGARVVLVSPQPAEESAKLAARFDAPMTFLVDDDNAAARHARDPASRRRP